MANALATDQIVALVKGNKKVSRKFMGVFGADEIPRQIPPNHYLIANCCPIHMPGIHWVGLYGSSSEIVELFDSTGSHPSMYSHLKLPKTCRVIRYNPRQIQGTLSNTCGHFCLLYLLCKSGGKSMEYMINHFFPLGQTLSENDSIVLQLMRVYYPSPLFL